MSYKGVIYVSAVVLAALGGGVLSAASGQPAGAAPPLTADAVGAVLDQYCVTCHNTQVVQGEGTAPSPLVAQLRMSGLALDALDTADVAAHPAAWESVARKLRGGSMPPVGRPRPGEDTLGAVAAWLETSLDRAAEVGP